MSHKSALQAIAGMEVDHTTNTREVLALCQAIAREELTVTSTRREGSGINGKADRKMAQDRKRALVAIKALERVKDNPSHLHCNIDGLYGISSATGSLVPAVEAELARMRGAIDDPERLRGIYRRNEGRA